MKKSFLATALLAFMLVALAGYLIQERISTPKPLGTEIAPVSQAGSPKLRLPIECTLGKDCFVLQYPDRDPSSGAVDFGCGRLTYDGHDGTDFAISDERVMASGVPVKAAVAGTVLRVRDGVADRRVVEQADEANLAGIECGNGVVIDHGSGWQTQYCHLRRGSVAVKPRTVVKTGAVLGLVGESGLASFPHVHLTVRHQGKVVDPFVGPNAGSGCQVSRQPLWAMPPAYSPTGLVRAGFSTQPPEIGDVWQGRFFETELPNDAKALIFWIQAYGVLQGDIEQFRLLAPDGTLVATQKQALKSPNRIWLSYTGKKATTNRPLMPGFWQGDYQLIRNGQVVINLSQNVQLR